MPVSRSSEAAMDVADEFRLVGWCTWRHLILPMPRPGG
jgi:hypothetical protein